MKQLGQWNQFLQEVSIIGPLQSFLFYSNMAATSNSRFLSSVECPCERSKVHSLKKPDTDSGKTYSSVNPSFILSNISYILVGFAEIL